MFEMVHGMALQTVGATVVATSGSACGVQFNIHVHLPSRLPFPYPYNEHDGQPDAA